MPSLKGMLLVATPPLVDDNFDRSVVLLLEHTADGALGLVLNRPEAQEVAGTLRSWAIHVTPPGVLFGGGPVQRDALIGLARAEPAEATEHWAPVLGPIGTVDLAADPADVGADLTHLRVFRGYAGWGPGQLEGELEAGAWIVADAHPYDAFSPQPEELWRAVLRRQGGRLSWLANFPDDPQLN